MKQVEQVRKEIEELNKEIKNRCFYIDWFNRNHQRASDMMEELKKSFEKYGFKDAVWVEELGNRYDNNFNYENLEAVNFRITIKARHRTYSSTNNSNTFFKRINDKIGLKLDLIKASFPGKIKFTRFNPYLFDAAFLGEANAVNEKEVQIAVIISDPMEERSLS